MNWISITRILAKDAFFREPESHGKTTKSSTQQKRPLFPLFSVEWGDHTRSLLFDRYSG